jgi:hypothetical protein
VRVLVRAPSREGFPSGLSMAPNQF